MSDGPQAPLRHELAPDDDWERAGSRPRESGMGRLARGLSILLLAGPSAQARPAQEEPGVRTFSMPDTRAAAALAERVREDLATRRWSEAAGGLQELLERHRDDLLGEQRPKRSQQPVHPGVSTWARETLLTLPPAARAAYRERHEPLARQALERARARGDTSALAAIARRWPLTEAAAEAWWTVGDLELERGNPLLALHAWSRALAAGLGLASLDLAAAGAGSAAPEDESRLAALPAGVQARLALARGIARSQAALAEPRTSELRLPGPGEGARSTPGEEAGSWARPYFLPDHPWQHAPVNLHPTLAGDALLVSTSMGLACVEAFSGEERWVVGEPPGWERLSPDQRAEFHDGLDQAGALVAAAASGSIAVAALQIPISQYESANFNSIPILKLIPDRRLFAFDLESGRELWNHMPPPGWDGEGGSFAERMRVAGPPVVHAGRVLVLVYRMQGRVDCHLACYALASGALQWSTQLVSGQRELNMFNRHEREYSAPPVRVEGDRIVALTQLGTIAAVDLFSGAILWQTLYEQIPLPSRMSYKANYRDPTWRNAPPVVADGVVLATPVDGDDLVGLDLESGAMLWSLRQRGISDLAGGRGTDVNLLLGADERRVYLAGRRLVALEAPTGLRFEPPTQRAWRVDDELLREEGSFARPVLTADRIVVPTTTQRIEIDRHQGLRLRHPIPWRDGRGGNLLIADGMLFTLNSRMLNGYFEWSFLLARARAAHEEAPRDSSAALELAGLLAERGRSEWEAGRSDQARSWLEEATAVLAPFLAEDARDALPEVTARMHAVLRAKARALADLADTRGALAALRNARAMAPTREAARDVLVEESELLRGRDDQERLRALEELEFTAGDLSLRCELVAEGQTEAAVLEAARIAPPLVYAPGEGARWRLAPLGDRVPRPGTGTWRIPVGLWVALERAEEGARRRDARLELGELYRLLELWPEEELPGGLVARLAKLRIAESARVHGAGALRPFEERAGAELEAALAAGERDGLERVARRFPSTAAARRAGDLLLEHAMREGDIERASGLVIEQLPDPFRPAQASERELELLLRLRALLAEAGNADYARDLLLELARARPSWPSPVASDGGRTLGELASAARAGLEPRERYAPGFEGTALARASFPGRHELLGRIPEPDPTRPDGGVLLFAVDPTGERSLGLRRPALVAFSAERPLEPTWTASLAEGEAPATYASRVAFAPGLAIVAGNRGLTAFARAGDGGAGARVWSWVAREGGVDSLHAASGVALVVVRLPGSLYRLHGLDVTSGAELWQSELPGAELGHEPVCGAGRAVFLPRNAHQRALVYDLFTGQRRLEIEMPWLRHEDSRGAWIEDGRILVPWFQQSRYPDQNQLIALDLESGSLAWRLSFQEMEGGRYLLHSIVQWAGNSFLVLSRSPIGREEGPAGLLLDLKTPFGGHARLRELGDDQRIVGVEARSRVELEAPLLLLSSSGSGERELRIQAIQLPYGTERWLQRLALPREELLESALPLPALGGTTVGLVLSRKSTRTGHYSELFCFDAASGDPEGSQVLDRGLGRSSEIALLPLGDALFLRGRDTLQVLR